MNLADAMKTGSDGFNLKLNYRGRHTFAQEPCTYDGRECVAYDVMKGNMDFFLIATADVTRDDLFDAFDRFLENMMKYTTEEANPYSAVLEYRDGKLVPALTVDHSVGYGVKTAMLIFGLQGETMLLGYQRDDLEERLRRSFAAGVDLMDARRGDEKTVRGLFGDHDLAVLTPPEEDADGMSGASDAGSRTGCDGVVQES